MGKIQQQLQNTYSIGTIRHCEKNVMVPVKGNKHNFGKYL